MIRKLKLLPLYFSTVRYLKWRQIFYQIFYRVKKIYSKGPRYDNLKTPIVSPLYLQPSIATRPSYTDGTFNFLNKEKTFIKEIDWNFSAYGKLWAYNLNYFDYLNQRNLETDDAIMLLDSFCKKKNDLRIGEEPYPISLRGINWIKFFTYQSISNNLYNSVLFAHYKHLAHNIEYHLLGNHLLENGFSLLFGAYYFKNEKLLTLAIRILDKEQEEQILSDGAHYELSPMYHQILLFRLLDCINLVKNNSWKSQTYIKVLTQTAIKMLGWLKAITFENGDIPMVNDSAGGIAPTSKQLFDYAHSLGISFSKTALSGSGYRLIRLNNVELFVDVAHIGPDYIPGHAHSDTFNFLVYKNGRPVIVDTGTSTYEKGRIRLLERSTKAHNTVMVQGEEQTEVWASFRVGRRAKIIAIEEGQNMITATHDGYKFLGITHQRSWHWQSTKIIIEDRLSSVRPNIDASAFLHFHPSISVSVDKGKVVTDSIQIEFFGHSAISVEEYEFAEGFNKVIKAKVLKIDFENRLTTTLMI